MRSPFQPTGLPITARKIAYHWIAEQHQDAERVKNRSEPRFAGSVDVGTWTDNQEPRKRVQLEYRLVNRQ